MGLIAAIASNNALASLMWEELAEGNGGELIGGRFTLMLLACSGTVGSHTALGLQVRDQIEA
jgi:hypothetical protein